MQKKGYLHLLRGQDQEQLARRQDLLHEASRLNSHRVKRLRTNRLPIRSIRKQASREHFRGGLQQRVGPGANWWSLLQVSGNATRSAQPLPALLGAPFPAPGTPFPQGPCFGAGGRADLAAWVFRCPSATGVLHPAFRGLPLAPQRLRRCRDTFSARGCIQACSPARSVVTSCSDVSA